jgi:hypothetical protein
MPLNLNLHQMSSDGFFFPAVQQIAVRSALYVLIMVIAMSEVQFGLKSNARLQQYYNTAR